jgi:predicted double-glycine peptidase
MIHIIDLPVIRQQKNYTCGTAVVKSILEHFGTSINEEKLANLLHSNKKVALSIKIL